VNVLRSRNIILPIALGLVFVSNSYTYAAEPTDESEIGFISIREDGRLGSTSGKKPSPQQNVSTSTNSQTQTQQSMPNMQAQIDAEMERHVAEKDARDAETERKIQEAMQRGDYNEMQRLMMEDFSKREENMLPPDMPQTSDTSNMQSRTQEPPAVQEALESVGFLNIASRTKDPNKPKINKPSQEAEKILSKLREISYNQQENKLDRCLSDMKLLVKQYPESAIFRKWLGIYYNANGMYQDSNDVFGHLLYMFPLDKNLWDDISIQYYFADNYRKLGDFNNAQITIDKILEKVKDQKTVDKVSVTTFRNMLLKRPDLVQMLFNYQNLLLEEATTKTVDKEKLDKIWDSIPKDDYKLLNNYYGFNLSTLEFLYGRFYNRKDILRNYVTHEGKTTDKETAKKVMEAKAIIADKY
jgi:tetratricopeptide (TPR) repeat protein